jgi:hypothetical protein
MFQVVTTVLKMLNKKYCASKCIRERISSRDDVLICARQEQSQILSLLLNQAGKLGHLVEKGPQASFSRLDNRSDASNGSIDIGSFWSLPLITSRNR